MLKETKIRYTNFFISFLLVGLMALACKSLTDGNTKINSPEISKAALYKEFNSIVNTGKPDLIREKIIELWSDSLIGKDRRWLEEDINYWVARHHEFGKLDFISFGKDQFDGNDIAWFYGRDCRDWVGFDFDFDENLRVDHTNILRSCIPSELNQKEGEKTALSIKDSLEVYFKNLEKKNLFSGAVLIAKGDDIIFNNAYGWSDKEKKIKNTLATHFVIASTTKMFTAVVIGLLLDQQKVELHSPISNYLTDLPKNIGDSLKLSHLLTHTSGIELDDFEGFMDEIRKAKNIEAFYQLNLKYLPKLEIFSKYQPPYDFDYSNENFDIMGQLIEQVSGSDFYNYLEKNIFEKIGMTKTRPIDMDNLEVDIAKNYQLNVEHKTNTVRTLVPHSDLKMSRPAGSFYSNTEDLYKFFRALNSNDLCSSKTKSLFTSSKVTGLDLPIYHSSYGYGFFTNKRYGLHNYGHAGGQPGTSTRCEYYPEKDVYVIILSNYNGAANISANYISQLISVMP